MVQVHVELRITAADPTVLVIEPFGSRLVLADGDTLAIEISSPRHGESPALLRAPTTLTLYLGTGFRTRIVINGLTQVFDCRQPQELPPEGQAAGALVDFKAGPLPLRTASPAPPSTVKLADLKGLADRTELANLFVGGALRWKTRSGVPLPIFEFEVRDLKLCKQQLAKMYIALDVRFTPDGQLAYHLEVPDLQLAGWSIPLTQDELTKLDRATQRVNVCPTLLHGPRGRSFALVKMCEELSHDFSSAYAQARRRYQAGNGGVARLLLKPLVAKHPQRLPAAHHLLGSCYRDEGDFDRATEQYLTAVNAATHPEGYLLPVAAGILFDLADVYKTKGEAAKAAHCLFHSLLLRPNHPEALAAYISLFPDWQKAWRRALSRIAAIGGRRDLLGLLVQRYAAAHARTPEQVLADLYDQAPTVDLTGRFFADFAPVEADIFLVQLGRTQGRPVRQRLLGEAKPSPPRLPPRPSTGFMDLGVLMMNLEIGLGGFLLAFGIRGDTTALVLGTVVILLIGACRSVVWQQPKTFFLAGVVNGLLIIAAVVFASPRVAVVPATAMVIFLLAFTQSEKLPLAVSWGK